MPSAQEAREARRRKILARGSDRLAFITGELPAIPSPTSASPVAPTRPGNDVPSTAIPRSGDAALIRLSETGPSGKPQENQELATADCDDNASARVIENVHEHRGALQEAQDFPEVEEVANLSTGSLQPDNDVQLTSLDRKGDGRGTASANGGRLATSVPTWDRIAASIDATRNYRASGALLLALIAVVQGFLVCTDPESRFCGNGALPWPVALVILTDISLVFGALLLGLVRTPSLNEHADVPDVSASEDQLGRVGEMSSQLESYLKVGAVVLKISQAVFLDCSIYAVMLISGYTLGQNWQLAFSK